VVTTRERYGNLKNPAQFLNQDSFLCTAAAVPGQLEQPVAARWLLAGRPAVGGRGAASPFARDASAPQPNAAPAEPNQRMPSQPAAHPMEAVSALAQRSARSLWYTATASLSSSLLHCCHVVLSWHCLCEEVAQFGSLRLGNTTGAAQLACMSRSLQGAQAVVCGACPADARQPSVRPAEAHVAFIAWVGGIAIDLLASIRCGHPSATSRRKKHAPQSYILLTTLTTATGAA
jgi:hypothetical protein